MDVKYSSLKSLESRNKDQNDKQSALPKAESAMSSPIVQIRRSSSAGREDIPHDLIFEYELKSFEMLLLIERANAGSKSNGE